MEPSGGSRKGTMRVHYASAHDYSRKELVPALESVLAHQFEFSGGVRGKSVLLKPNLLAWRRKDDIACVNPALITETARIFLDAGAAKVSLLENPGVQTARMIVSAMGIDLELAKMHVSVSGFSRFERAPNNEKAVFRNLELASDYREFDCVVDLAKAKTHGMMVLTLCVKNLFGMVSGSARLGWHLTVRREFDRFADMLLDLYLAVHPQYNVLDGIVCMQGNGPGSGGPAFRGFLAGSADALALDFSAARILGAPDMPVLAAAKRRSLLPETLEETGTVPEPDPLWLADPPGPFIEWGVGFPPFLREFLRKHMLSSPSVDPSKCVGCGLCAKMCPPQTLKIVSGKPRFDLKTCIRCCCCQEHCPKGAITFRKAALSRLMDGFEKLTGKSR